MAGLTPRELVRALEKAGFFIHGTSGSHVHLKHPEKPGRVTVPYHQRFDLPKHIVKSILRQAGLFNDEFFRLLDREPDDFRAGDRPNRAKFGFGCRCTARLRRCNSGLLESIPRRDALRPTDQAHC